MRQDKWKKFTRVELAKVPFDEWEYGDEFVRIGNISSEHTEPTEFWTLALDDELVMFRCLEGLFSASCLKLAIKYAAGRIGILTHGADVYHLYKNGQVDIEVNTVASPELHLVLDGGISK